MATHAPDDHTMQDIRALLSATDPAPDGVSSAERDRLRQIRAAVLTAGGSPADQPAGRIWPSRLWRGRSWRPGPLRQRRLIVTAIAVPVLLAATGAGWLISLSPAALRVAPDVACFSASTRAASRRQHYQPGAPGPVGAMRDGPPAADRGRDARPHPRGLAPRRPPGLDPPDHVQRPADPAR